MLRAIRRFLFLCLVLAIAAGAWLWRDLGVVLSRPMSLSVPTSLEIPPGSNLVQIIGQLEQAGLIGGVRAPLYLRLYARLHGLDASLKAGEYELSPGLSPLGFLELMVAGRTKLHELRIVEGWSFAQALAAVRAEPSLVQAQAGASPAEIMAALGRPGQLPEGRLFPDTYSFTRGMSDTAFLRRALEAMDQALQQEWATRAPGLPYATPDEALTMASIVEKETGAPDERPAIAGVFVRRLRLGMRLQTDPTVIYGMGERFDGNLRRVDLETDGPYNTYLRTGLPPGPICLPGRAALHAAMHPADGDALYFVARGDGSHQFSATLEQHEAAVRKFQLGHK
ncbi:MAG TPA: endolytic transglycosylase MltG [Solimonas sp.]|nr:endolytic transglycosylase MltG [Solimonas sp.]